METSKIQIFTHIYMVTVTDEIMEYHSNDHNHFLLKHWGRVASCTGFATYKKCVAHSFILEYNEHPNKFIRMEVFFFTASLCARTMY